MTAGISRVADFNRRTLDGLAARLYFYYSLVHEHTDTLADIRRCACLSVLIIFQWPDLEYLRWDLRAVQIIKDEYFGFAAICSPCTGRLCCGMTSMDKRRCSTCCCGITFTTTFTTRSALHAFKAFINQQQEACLVNSL